jgi:hypothetical protein
MDASHLSWNAAYKSAVRRVATSLKWEGGSITSAKAKGPLNSKGLSPWLAYLYKQHLVTLMFVSMREGSPHFWGLLSLEFRLAPFFHVHTHVFFYMREEFSPKVKVIPFPLDVYNNGTEQK